MALRATDVTVISTCSSQGRFLHPSFLSVKSAIEKADAAEWLVACGSEEPGEYLSTGLDRRAELLCHRDGLVAAINQAVQRAQGKFISIIGGDFLVSSNWFNACVAEDSERARPTILHPAAIVYHGSRRVLYITPDQEHPDFSLDALRARNAFVGPSFGAKEVFVQHPFEEPNHAQGFGHYEWHWTCETIAAGVVHKPLAGTLACKELADEKFAGEEELLLPPSRLFAPNYAMSKL